MIRIGNRGKPKNDTLFSNNRLFSASPFLRVKQLQHPNKTSPIVIPIPQITEMITPHALFRGWGQGVAVGSVVGVIVEKIVAIIVAVVIAVIVVIPS